MRRARLIEGDKGGEGGSVKDPGRLPDLLIGEVGVTSGKALLAEEDIDFKKMNKKMIAVDCRIRKVSKV